MLKASNIKSMQIELVGENSNTHDNISTQGVNNGKKQQL